MASPDRLCRHCELPLPDESSAWVREGFCCRGCKTVHGVLQAGGLDRYYALRDGAGVPVGELPDEHDLGWIEELRAAPSPRIEIDVQGMHCAGCVWVIEKLFERHGSGSLELNPTLGRAELLVGDDYDLEGFARDVEALGYRLGPAGEESRSKSDGLLLRTGICLALAGNGMFYAAATYFGLDEGPIYRLLSQMAYGAAALAVLVGGSVFIRAAWQALRRGVVHLDLPIALGILLSFAGASWSYFTGGEARYVDTVTIFIALMLLGRWLQERVLERNRRQLLDDRGAESLRTRRVVESEGSEQIRLVRAVEIDAGDLLHLAAGDLVPVDAELLDAEGSFSLDWIDGESEPRPYRRGEVVPAGAFHVGRTARRMRAAQPFEDSAVRRLLRRPQARDDDGAAWWQRIAKWYVAGVLLAAGAAIAAWWGLAGAPHTAVEVATAVLVVTCPCAFGIATPLAYELAHARLRRRGLFVRTRSFLDRARALRRLVFDKTGTLTTGRLSLADEAPLDALEDEARAVLAALAASNAHPKSQAVARALEARGVRSEALPTREEPGRGVEVERGGRLWRLGSPRWVSELGASALRKPGEGAPGEGAPGEGAPGEGAPGEGAPGEGAPGSDGADLAFAVDGELLARFRTEERLRPDAARELRALAEHGYETWILSGDAPARVAAIAEEVGIASERALGGRDPDAKAAFLRAHPKAETLMIGDGLNDSLAATEAGCAGTPAIDRPFLAARSDFYFTTPGLGPILDALATAEELARAVRQVLIFAVAYNLGAVAIAFSGVMEPWLAAILMPISSLLSIAWIVWRLGPRRAPARDALPRLTPLPAPR